MKDPGLMDDAELFATARALGFTDTDRYVLVAKLRPLSEARWKPPMPVLKTPERTWRSRSDVGTTNVRRDRYADRLEERRVRAKERIESSMRTKLERISSRARHSEP